MGCSTSWFTVHLPTETLIEAATLPVMPWRYFSVYSVLASFFSDAARLISPISGNTRQPAFGGFIFENNTYVSMYCGQYILFYCNLTHTATRNGLPSGVSLCLIKAARRGSPPPFGASTPSVHNTAENGLYPNAQWAVIIDYYSNARWAAGISLRDGSNNTVVAKVKAHWAADEFGVFGACFVAVSLQDQSNIGVLMADHFWLFSSVIAKDQPDAALVDHGPSQPLIGGGPRVNGKFAAEAVVPHVVDNHGINNLLEGSVMFECQYLLDDVKRLLGESDTFVAVDMPCATQGPLLEAIHDFDKGLDFEKSPVNWPIMGASRHTNLATAGINSSLSHISSQVAFHECWTMYINTQVRWYYILATDNKSTTGAKCTRWADQHILPQTGGLQNIQAHLCKSINKHTILTDRVTHLCTHVKFEDMKVRTAMASVLLKPDFRSRPELLDQTSYAPNHLDLYWFFFSYVHRLLAGLVGSSPGFRQFVTKAWTVFIATRNSKARGFRELLHFVDGDSGSICDVHVVEYTAGAGGSLDELAALICAHLNIDGRVVYIWSAIHFAVAFEPARTSTGNPELGDFHRFLRLRGIVRRLTEILWDVTSDSSDSLTSNTRGELLTNCLSLLVLELCNPDGYLWLPQALRSGLLGCFARIVTLCDSGAHISNLRKLLEYTQSATVYYSVVQNLACHLPTALVHADSPIYSQWMKFVSLAQERLDTTDASVGPAGPVITSR
ncbi:hypothetical protein B0H10DRAFT_1956504 [Mycena sp. CBHHK59/15]|nr:hypothetical protein B0H10DRAFT_1956504 [Mycena sp. CBHHK59/15]